MTTFIAPYPASPQGQQTEGVLVALERELVRHQGLQRQFTGQVDSDGEDIGSVVPRPDQADAVAGQVHRCHQRRVGGVEAHPHDPPPVGHQAQRPLHGRARRVEHDLGPPSVARRHHGVRRIRSPAVHDMGEGRLGRRQPVRVGLDDHHPPCPSRRDQARQHADRPRAEHGHGVAEGDVRREDVVEHTGQRLHQHGLTKPHAFRKPFGEAFRQHDVVGVRAVAVDADLRSSLVLAEIGRPTPAGRAAAAEQGGVDHHPVGGPHRCDIRPRCLHHTHGLVPENHTRPCRKAAEQNLAIGTADSRPGDSDQDVVAPGNVRKLTLSYLDGAGTQIHQCFHGASQESTAAGRMTQECGSGNGSDSSNMTQACGSRHSAVNVHYSFTTGSVNVAVRRWCCNCPACRDVPVPLGRSALVTYSSGKSVTRRRLAPATPASRPPRRAVHPGEPSTPTTVGRRSGRAPAPAPRSTGRNVGRECRERTPRENAERNIEKTRRDVSAGVERM